MTSGGDAAGMNPAVKSAAEYARKQGLSPYLVEWGLRGLIEGWIHEATDQRLSGILHRGGTVLGSSRSKRFFEYEYRKKAYKNLERLGITQLIVIGGDGSFSALNQFYADFGVPFAGIPATIDNDIAGTDYCLGVDTALNMIRQSVDSIRDTASSFSRAFVIEVMGRDCGYLAMTSALATGAEGDIQTLSAPAAAKQNAGTKAAPQVRTRGGAAVAECGGTVAAGASASYKSRGGSASA